ncbi:DNA cytosine methyltransferase [Streptomyces monticola]|uniref:DNA (cytosine-5-)-methyltransferase n=1 Tax=Streptomyces monticola TaxID=2666263 RepID=A0ABW2JBW6_9ACTN
MQSVLGGRIAWHVENDPRAQQVLARHWPGVPNLGDLRTMDWSRVEPVDVLTAGIPCQDLSLAGPRTGLAGTRSGLWRHVATAISHLNPNLVVLENVRGLLSTRAGTDSLRALEHCTPCVGDPVEEPGMRALGAVLADLAERGRDAQWGLFRASDVGAPHQRARVFVLAWRPSTPVERHGSRTRTCSGRRGCVPAAHSQSQRRCQGFTEPEARQRQPHSRLHGGGTDCPHINRGCGSRRTRASAADPDLLRRQRRCGHHIETQRRREPPHRHHSPREWWAPYLPAIRRWEHITGRAAPSPTVPGTRRLSAELVEWMMGLPEGWVTHTEGLSRAAQLRLLGNSVVPQQAAHAVGLLLKASAEPTEQPPIGDGAAGATP